MSSSRLRPNRSPSTPKVSSNSVTGTRKASEIQVSCDELVPRSCWNSPLRTAGMASATCPTHTASAAATSVPVRQTRPPGRLGRCQCRCPCSSPRCGNSDLVCHTRVQRFEHLCARRTPVSAMTHPMAGASGGRAARSAAEPPPAGLRLSAVRSVPSGPSNGVRRRESAYGGTDQRARVRAGAGVAAADARGDVRRAADRAGVLPDPVRHQPPEPGGVAADHRVRRDLLPRAGRGGHAQADPLAQPVRRRSEPQAGGHRRPPALLVLARQVPPAADLDRGRSCCCWRSARGCWPSAASARRSSARSRA